MLCSRENRKNTATLLEGQEIWDYDLKSALINHVSLGKEFLSSGAQFPQL
jgi:hypothetical protein